MRDSNNETRARLVDELDCVRHELARLTSEYELAATHADATLEERNALWHMVGRVRTASRKAAEALDHHDAMVLRTGDEFGDLVDGDIDKRKIVPPT